MIHHDLLTMYSIKAEEYFIAVAFLILFIPFWRFLNPAKAVERATEREAPALLERMVDWFFLPDSVFYHPGHAWVRADAGDLATVGMDDFSRKLVGRKARLVLPEPGLKVSQGEKGWQVMSDGKSVDMLSPIDGTVVEVNDRFLNEAGDLPEDPYGEGWLFKVRPSRLEANKKNIFSGDLALRWMEGVSENLRRKLSPDLGLLYQDGGLPVEGMARGLDPEHWDEVAREFFLT